MEFQIGASGWQEMSLANLNSDQDNDGVPDCEDLCPNSITTPTVAGLLTGAQKGAIERCAAQSSIGK